MYLIILSRYIFIEINILIRIKILFSKYLALRNRKNVLINETIYKTRQDTIETKKKEKDFNAYNLQNTLKLKCHYISMNMH